MSYRGNRFGNSEDQPPSHGRARPFTGMLQGTGAMGGGGPMILFIRRPSINVSDSGLRQRSRAPSPPPLDRAADLARDVEVQLQQDWQQANQQALGRGGKYPVLLALDTTPANAGGNRLSRIRTSLIRRKSSITISAAKASLLPHISQIAGGTVYSVDEASAFGGDHVRTSHGWPSQTVFTTHRGNVYWASADASSRRLLPLPLPDLDRDESIADAQCGDTHIAVLTDLGRVFHYASAVKRPTVLATARDDPIVQIVCTLKATLLLGHSGRVYAHGSGPKGELGLGEKIVDLQGEDARQVSRSLKHVAVQRLAAGPDFAAAITASGRVLAWGSNRNKQLGESWPDKVLWPLPLESAKLEKTRVCDIACGNAFIALLTKSGELHVTGCDLVNDATFSYVPDAESDDTCIVGISASAGSVAAVHEDGAVTVFKASRPSSRPRPSETLPLEVLAQVPASGPGTLHVSVFHDLVLAFGASHEAREDRGQHSKISRLGVDATSVLMLIHTKPVEEMVDALVRSLGDPYGLSASFLLEEDTMRNIDPNSGISPSGVDLSGAQSALEEVWDRLEGDRDSRAAIGEALDAVLASLESHVESVTHADQVRLFLLFLCTPLARMVGGEAYGRLMIAVNVLTREDVRQLHKWIFEEMSAHALAAYIVEPLADLVSEEAKKEPLRASRELRATANFLRSIFNINEVHGAMQLEGREGHVLVDRKRFATDVLLDFDRLILNEMLQEWTMDHARGKRAPFSMLQFPFLLSVDTKSEFLRIEGAHIMMQRYQNARRRGQQATLVLSVRRDRVLMDTIRELRAKDPVDMKMPLVVKFEGEEGVDAGGVKKEFFELLSTSLFDPRMGIFTTIDVGGAKKLWFTSGTGAQNSVDFIAQFLASEIASSPHEADENELFVLVGQLIGLAIYNNTILDVQFPIAFYRMLLSKLPESPTLAHLHELDPDLARGLQHMLDYDGDDVETVFCADFAGLRPDGENIPVTNENREAYVTEKIRFKLRDEFFEVADKLMEGFGTVIDPNMKAFGLFRPDELEEALIGSDAVDIEELRATALYEGGYTQSSRVVKWFWEIVMAWNTDKQRELLRFATGAPRAPVGGLRSLHFCIQRAGPDSDKLPTASTCFNVLLLPEYRSKTKLASKLEVALDNAQGFGLS